MGRKSKHNLTFLSLFETQEKVVEGDSKPKVSPAPGVKNGTHFSPPSVVCPKCGVTAQPSVRQGEFTGKYYCVAGCSYGEDNFYFSVELKNDS